MFLSFSFTRCFLLVFSWFLVVFFPPFFCCLFVLFVVFLSKCFCSFILLYFFLSSLKKKKEEVMGTSLGKMTNKFTKAHVAIHDFSQESNQNEPKERNIS